MKSISLKNSVQVLSVVFGVLIFALGPTASAQEESTNPVEDGVKKTQIVLQRRTNPEYGKSAYSFRYQTQAKAKHKNHVDIVYSANGNLRISNHGGLTTGVIDLGDTVGKGFDVTNIKKRDWQMLQIKPIAGHYYVQVINADQHEMKVVYHLDKVTEEKVELTAWYEKDNDTWPVSLERRGEAGTSGMNRSSETAR